MRKSYREPYKKEAFRYKIPKKTSLEVTDKTYRKEMNADILFYIIIAIILINFVKDKILDTLNAKHFNEAIPEELNDVYDEDEYKKSQNYKATNHKFGIWSSLFSLVLSCFIMFLAPGP